MEPDQRQKEVCPPGEAGQSGQEEHILVGHGDHLREAAWLLKASAADLIQREEGQQCSIWVYPGESHEYGASADSSSAEKGDLW